MRNEGGGTLDFECVNEMALKFYRLCLYGVHAIANCSSLPDLTTQPA